MAPKKSDFTKAEWRIIESHRTPAQVQRFLRSLDYNWESNGETCLSFRRVIRQGKAHCLEGAMTAAVILEQHGYPPLLVSIESQDLIDHVLFPFNHFGHWGAVARSRDLGLHGRRPVYRTVRDLVMSYFDPYIDKTGRITAYGVADLRHFGNYDWRFSARNVWKVERYLQQMPHRKIKSSDSRYKKWRRRYLTFRAQYPDSQADYYSNRHLWLL